MLDTSGRNSGKDNFSNLKYVRYNYNETKTVAEIRYLIPPRGEGRLKTPQLKGYSGYMPYW